MNLTEQQIAFKAKLKEARMDVRAAKRIEKELLEQCVHYIAPLSPTELKKQEKDQWYSEHVGCELCKVDFGWRCKESPDQVCHYFTVLNSFGMHVVNLMNGLVVPVPRYFADDATEEDKSKPYCSDYETSDICLFCGMPDERK